MKKILLTGFEPFLHYNVNPTMKVVNQFKNKVINDYEIHAEILVVDFKQSAIQFKQLIEKVQPDIIISLGLAGGRFKITPERIAINTKDGEPDNSGYTPIDEAIYPDGNDAYFTNLPIRQMINQLLEKGYPAEISNSAGTYLCNNIMYEGLKYALSKNSNILSGFIHIPASHELAIQHGKIPSWSLDDLTESIRICIEVATSPNN